nr:hypothetical protein [Bacteroidota bacterium]
DTSSALSKVLNDQTQQSAFIFQRTINYPITSFAVNNLGELYIINTNNQLKKLNEKGDSVGVFNQVTKYGKLTYVDAQNPWKTILFYKNFSNIVLLDKYLNVLTNINLRKQNIFGVRAVASSYDNNIWLFDEQENKLKKINDAGKLLMESIDFRQVFDSVPSPSQIIDRDGFVYLFDPHKGIYIFDYYGAFKNKIPFLNWKDIVVIGKNIYGFDESFLYKYSLGSLDLKKYLLPSAFKNFTSLKVSANKIYFLKNNLLNVYSMQ